MFRAIPIPRSIFRMFADPTGRRSRRRQFLLAAAGVASTPLLVAPLWADDQSEASDPITLRPNQHQIYRVRIELEIEGNVNVPKNPLVSSKSDVKLPIRSDALFEYEERFHRATANDQTGVVPLLERYYYQAESTSELNRSRKSTSLRDSVRSTLVRRESLPEVVYAIDDSFQRDELELLRTPVCSPAVDQLLPATAIQAGDQYTPSSAVMMSLLNLTAVHSTDVSVEVVSITASDARLQFRGDVQGSVEGIPTTVRLAGKLTFDRQQATCSWLAMAIHETREAGKAEPGFDVAGTIKMIRKPMNQAVSLPVTKPRLDVAGPIPEGRLYVDLQSDQLGIQALMDRNWRMMTDIPGAAMMRMIDNEQSIAQCDFIPLATLEAGQQWTLEALQQEVKKTLGDQMTGLVGGDQQVSGGGLRVMRVVARGAVANVPIQWVVLHFSNDSGRRVLATFTMEGDHVEEFAGSDDQLISSLRFTDPVDPSQSDVTVKDTDPVEIARQPHGAGDSVQSASDYQ